MRAATIKRDITKLPKWAQRRIEILELDIEHLKTQMEGLHGNNQANTNFEIGHTLPTPKRVFLPDGGTVYFLDRKGHTLDVRVSRRSGIKVSSWGTLRVYPEAANSVRIEVVGKSERR